MEKSPFSVRFRISLLALLLGLAVDANAVDITGLVYPLHDLILSAGVSGAVLSKDVTLGQIVPANHLLLALDDTLQTLEIERRKVMLDDKSEINAEKERSEILKGLLDMAQEAYDTAGAVSKDELSHMNAEYITSRGKYEVLLAQKHREAVELRAAERDRDMRRIYAPVGGVVTKINLEVGEWARQGDPLIHLVDANTCIIKFALPLQYAYQLKAGTMLPVSVDEDTATKNFQGKLTYISSVADPASGLVEGKITFNNATLKIKPGVKAVIHFPTPAGK